MPKATRKRITNRGQVEVNDSTGSSNVPAATRSRAMAPSSNAGKVVSRNDYSGSAWASLSGSFRELARQAEKAELKAEREAEKAQAKAEAEAQKAQDRADRMEASAAAVGVVKETADLYAAIRRGDIDETGLEAAALGMAGRDTANPYMQNIFAKAGVSMAEKGFELLSQRNETVLAGDFENFFVDETNSLFDSNADIDDETFYSTYLKIRDAAEANGWTKERYDTLFLKRLMGRSRAFVGTEAGERLRDRAVALYNQGKINPSTIADAENFDTFLAEFDKLSLERNNTQAKLAKENQELQYAEARAQIVNRFAVAPLDEKLQIINQLRDDPDSAKAILGDSFGSVLSTFESAYFQQVNRQDTLEAKASEKEMRRIEGEIRAGLYSGDLQDIQNNKILLDFHKITLNNIYHESITQRDEYIDLLVKDAANAYSAFLSKGAGFLQNPNNPQVQIHNIETMRQHLLEAYEEFRGIDPGDTEAVKNRNRRMQETVRQVAMAAARGEYMGDYQEKEFKPYSIAGTDREAYLRVTAPSNGNTARPGRISINSAEYAKLPDNVKARVKEDLMRTSAQTLAAEARRHEEQAAIQRVPDDIRAAEERQLDFADEMFNAPSLFDAAYHGSDLYKDNPPVIPFLDDVPETVIFVDPSGEASGMAEGLEALDEMIERGQELPATVRIAVKNPEASKIKPAPKPASANPKYGPIMTMDPFQQ